MGDEEAAPPARHHVRAIGQIHGGSIPRDGEGMPPKTHIRWRGPSPIKKWLFACSHTKFEQKGRRATFYRSSHCSCFQLNFASAFVSSRRKQISSSLDKREETKIIGTSRSDQFYGLICSNPNTQSNPLHFLHLLYIVELRRTLSLTRSGSVAT